ncbi:MAG: hypothetical protein WBW41_12990 [Verrucomicrobiia bacterium]
MEKALTAMAPSGVTTIAKACVSLSGGEPLSETRTWTFCVVPALATGARQLKIPLLAPMLAPAGARGLLKVRGLLPFVSVALAVKLIVCPALTA